MSWSPRISGRLNLLVGLFVITNLMLFLLAYTTSTGQSAARQSLVQLATTASAAQTLQFDLGDFNGWQTAYALEVARLGPAAAKDDARARKAFLAAVGRARADLAKLTALSASQPTVTQANLDAVSEGLDQFMVLDEEIVSLYRRGSPQAQARADDLVLNDEIQIFTATAARLAVIVDELKLELAERAEAAEAHRQTVVTTYIALSLGGLMVVVGVSLMITRSIRRPLIKLAQCSDRIAAGDFDFDIGPTTRDEAGQALAAMDRMQSNLAALLEQVSRIAAIVDSSDDAICGATLDGKITSWNRAAEEIFGYPKAEAVGRSLAMLLPEDRKHEVEQMLAQLRADERVGMHDAVRRRKDGSHIDVSITMSAIRDRKGTLTGASKVIRDISERKQAEIALAAAKEAAEVTSQAFEAFSYSVAHDLRAPLRSIDGFSAILATEYSDVLDEEGRTYLERVRKAAQRMSELIESLLLLAQVTYRELASEPVDLSELSRSVVDRLRQDEPDRDVAFVVQPGLVAHGDGVLLGNAMDNLLRNAWKFTSGCQDARIEFGRASDGYFIRDNGAGFDMVYSDKLFGVFKRLHTADQFAGTGVGLATVQRIIERHRGRIWAEGSVGRGATFHFTLDETARLPGA